MSKNSFSDNVLAGVVAIFLIFVAVAWVAACYGFTISVMWGWFIAPLFGIQAINVAQGVGLALFYRVMQRMPRTKKGESDFNEDMKHSFVGVPVMCGLVMLCGWIAKGFV